jgi:threonine dehydratase
MIGILDILTARKRIAPFVHATPLRHSDWLSAAVGATVHLKLESLQLTNSFKLRGAMNAALRLIERAGGDPGKAPRIVTASAGNHGRAMALVSKRLGLDTVVFTPRTAPATKKAAIRSYGVELRDDAPHYDAAEAAARAYASAEGAVFISPYNHPDVIAGAGTVALEILDLLSTIAVVVVPVGGGGLASGLGLAIKAALPDACIVGVETAASTPFAASIAAGRIVEIDAQPSLADGLTGNLEPESLTFALVQRTVDRLVNVTEEEIASAIRGLAAEEHIIAEGAGAVATAAVLNKRVVATGEVAVVLVTGANIDLDKLCALLR